MNEMAQETERKFLLAGDFRPYAVEAIPITQGYLCTDPERTVRVRMRGEVAYLTIKSAPDKRGWSRYEFEQQIPAADARELLGMCVGNRIEKVRHIVPYGGQTWEVDVFGGANEGLVVAEVELRDENESIQVPEWVGREVTGDARYYNSALSVRPYKEWARRG